MSSTSDSSRTARETELFLAQVSAQHRRASRMFAWLMLAQWAGAIITALAVSPYTWIGEQNYVHQHVWLAVILGGVLASLPMGMAFTMPDRALTRHFIAAAQMVFSALLIHLSGGRIETHFHVFGSIALLSYYRDWRVLVTATLVVTLDHALRGLYAPLSVFGAADASPWRWVEHAGWVLYEDAFLIGSCLRGIAEWREIAARQAGLEDAKAATEREVQVRTSELHAANIGLHLAVEERENLQEKLMAASREAGMAEVATGVLHNVGNVLNSVNVSAMVVADRLRRSEIASLKQAGEMIHQHQADLPQFLSSDTRGKHLASFLQELGKHLADEQRTMLAELEGVTRGVDHIKHVISMQQTHAKRRALVELVNPSELLESALKMQQGVSLDRDITIERRYQELPPVPLDQHRMLQVLANLISNARNALRDSGRPDKKLILCVRHTTHEGRQAVAFEVSDNGVGIPAENLARIFALGFTTRSEGHGFGLHGAATMALEMGGALTAHSDGLGKGATFTVSTPMGEATTGPAGVTRKEVRPCTAS